MGYNQIDETKRHLRLLNNNKEICEMTYHEYVLMIIVFLLLAIVFSMLGWMGYTLNKLEKRISKMMRQSNDLQNGRRAKETH